MYREERHLSLSRKKSRMGSITDGFHYLGIQYSPTQTENITKVTPKNYVQYLSCCNSRWTVASTYQNITQPDRSFVRACGFCCCSDCCIIFRKLVVFVRHEFQNDRSPSLPTRRDRHSGPRAGPINSRWRLIGRNFCASANEHSILG